MWCRKTLNLFGYDIQYIVIWGNIHIDTTLVIIGQGDQYIETCLLPLHGQS